jgi:hypothetical protein
VIPDELLPELKALAERAGIDVPIVDDIPPAEFSGDLTEEHVDAAKRAAKHVAGTLYATYYGIPVAEIARLADTDVAGFVRLCDQRARIMAPGERGGGGASWLAHTRTLLEQVQIVTADNLAALIGALGMSPALAVRLPELARQGFQQVCVELQRKEPALVDAARAWRQVIFVAAHLPKPTLTEFVMWTGAEVAKLPLPFRTRFGQVYSGLCLAVATITPGPEHAPEARVLLGNAPGKHWMLEP